MKKMIVVLVAMLGLALVAVPGQAADDASKDAQIADLKAAIDKLKAQIEDQKLEIESLKAELRSLRPLAATQAAASQPTLASTWEEAQLRNKWQKDFGVFGEEVKSAVNENKNIDALFSGQRVLWTVTVRSIASEADIPVRFEEAMPLLKNTPPIRIELTLRLSERSKVPQIKPGSKITVYGTMGLSVKSELQKAILMWATDCVVREIVPPPAKGK